MTPQKRSLSRKAAAAGLIVLAAAVVLGGVLWLRSRGLPAYLEGETDLFSPVMKPSGLEDRSYFLAGDRYLLRLDTEHPSMLWEIDRPAMGELEVFFRAVPKGEKAPAVGLRIAVGLAGTPMLAFDNTVMTDKERWSLVHYIQSPRRKEAVINDLLAPTDGLIHATRIRRKVPTEPGDLFWENLDAARIVLNPLWPEKNAVYAAAVRAVHDGKRLAVLCTWKDPLRMARRWRSRISRMHWRCSFCWAATHRFWGWAIPMLR